MKKVLRSYTAQASKLTAAQEQTHKARRALAMLQKRDTFNRELQQNWKHQIKQMEKAVLLCADIQKRDRTNFQAELKTKDEQIEKLKVYIQKTNQIRNRPKKAKTMFGASPIRNAIGRSGRSRPSLKKKRRPARAISVDMDAPASC